jgi:succinate dehydrogenase / fumarate reductase, cytochrome b subunit
MLLSMTPISLSRAMSSSIGQKLITAITGILLVGFVIAHLTGNLLILVPDGGKAFNAYALGLKNLGGLLILAEVGLVVFFGAHILNGIRLKLNHRSARPQGYQNWKSKGAPSRANSSSMTMIVTGTILAVFLVLHIVHFKFGPGIDAGYKTTINGVEARDLRRLVVESFQTGWIAALYIGVMVMLGAHLRHGFWSAFQSLGMINPRWSQGVSIVGVLLAAILTIGFVGIPAVVFLGGVQ